MDREKVIENRLNILKHRQKDNNGVIKKLERELRNIQKAKS